MRRILVFALSLLALLSSTVAVADTKPKMTAAQKHQEEVRLVFGWLIYLNDQVGKTRDEAKKSCIRLTRGTEGLAETPGLKNWYQCGHGYSLVFDETGISIWAADRTFPGINRKNLIEILGEPHRITNDGDVTTLEWAIKSTTDKVHPYRLLSFHTDAASGISAVSVFMDDAGDLDLSVPEDKPQDRGKSAPRGAIYL